ncbi:hypothetical protein EON79_03855 [bacterium]|nr:MAG: hypothetical protein EON79_03855 [bacterium]
MSKLSKSVLLGAFAAILPSAPAEDLPTLLQKALNRAPTLRYSGERTISFRRDGKPFDTREIVYRDGNRVRIEYPEGSKQAGQIIVEVGDRRRHFTPGKNEIRLLPARREESLERLRRFIKMLQSKGGSVSESPGEKVAGIPTGQIVFRDQSGNVMQRLYIDPRSGAVLKRSLYDPGGAPVGTMVFTRIEYGRKVSPALFRLDRKGARIVTPVDELKELLVKGGFADVRLPNMELEFVRILETPDSPTLLQVYALKGERVSLFQTKGKLDPSKLKRQRGLDLKTRAWSEGGRNFALIGTLNDKTMDELVAILRDRA